MQCMYVVALLVAMAATTLAATDTVTSGPVSITVNETGGVMHFKASETKSDDSDDSGETDDVSSATTVGPVESTDGVTTAPSEEGKRRKRRSTEMEDNKVQLKLVSLKEMDAEGAVVGGDRPADQKTADMTMGNFVMSTPSDNTEIPHTVGNDGKELKSSSVSLMLAAGPTTFKIQIYIAHGNGNLTIDNEVTSVQQYNFVVRVAVENWEFCTGDACAVEGVNKAGDYLELEGHLMGDGDAEVMDSGANEPKAFDIGKDNVIYMSKMSKNTNNDDSVSIVALTQDYPTLEKAGTDLSKVIWRFPKFEKDLEYYGVLKMTIPGSDKTGGASAVVGSMMLTLMAALLAAVFRM